VLFERALKLTAATKLFVELIPGVGIARVIFIFPLGESMTFSASMVKA